MGVIVNVGRPEVLLVGVPVCFVRVRHRWVVVLMCMSGGQVHHVLSRPLIVSHMDVLLLVDEGFVFVLLLHLASFPACDVARHRNGHVARHRLPFPGAVHASRQAHPC